MCELYIRLPLWRGPRHDFGTSDWHICQVCLRLASDVISPMFVKVVFPDNAEKFRDPRIFGGFSRNSCPPKVDGDVIAVGTVGMDVHVKRNDSKSTRSGVTRAAHFVMDDEQTNKRQSTEAMAVVYCVLPKSFYI